MEEVIHYYNEMPGPNGEVLGLCELPVQGIVSSDWRMVTCNACLMKIDPAIIVPDLPKGWRYEQITPNAPKGIWFVYGYDTCAYPLFVSDDELTALRWFADYGVPCRVKFWEFGTAWMN
jgi:hypothetical protein